jgi:hypothetical protein
MVEPLPFTPPPPPSHAHPCPPRTTANGCRWLGKRMKLNEGISYNGTLASCPSSTLSCVTPPCMCVYIDCWSSSTSSGSLAATSVRSPRDPTFAACASPSYTCTPYPRWRALQRFCPSTAISGSWAPSSISIDGTVPSWSDWQSVPLCPTKGQEPVDVLL